MTNLQVQLEPRPYLFRRCPNHPGRNTYNHPCERCGWWPEAEREAESGLDVERPGQMTLLNPQLEMEVET
jgi:hypothetical protein